MAYQTEADVKYWHQLYAKPIPIVAACERLIAQQEQRVRRQHDYGWWAGWWSGVAVALTAVLCGALIVWWVQ